MSEDIPTLRRILQACKTVAVVGLSAEWHRPSNFVGKYLQSHGYRVIPVNPRYDSILGERCYARLEDIPEPVDMVDVFRKPADVPPIAASAVAIGAKCLWQQLGVREPRGRRHGARCGAGLGDGPLRQDRTRAAVRRPALGGCRHAGDQRAEARNERPPLPARDPGHPRRPDPRRRHRRARAADLPDDELRLRQRRPRGQRCSTCRPSATSTRACATPPWRRWKSASPRSKAAAPRWPAASGMAAEAMALMTILQAGDHVVAAGALYGGSVTMLAVNLQQVRHRDDLRRRHRPDGLRRRDAAEHARRVRREPGQPEPGGARHRRRRRRWRTRTACRWSIDNTVPSPFLCNPLAHGADIVVHTPPSTWPATAPRWAAWSSRVGQVPVGQRQVSRHDRALAGLPRREVLRDLRRLRLHDALPHGDACASTAPRCRR